MFAGQPPSSQGRRILTLTASVVAHISFLAVWCWPPAPVLVRPTLRAQGNHGTSVVLYFAPPAQQQFLVAEPAKPRVARLYAPRQKKQQFNAKSTDLPDTPAHNTDAQVSSTAPGTTQGTDPFGLSTGADVRPAIETTNLDPPISKSEIPAGVEGDVIVEITIDDQGNVVGERLLQGIGYGIDEKIMSFVHNLHYRPATKDGVPIPSRNDHHWHFHG